MFAVLAFIRSKNIVVEVSKSDLIMDHAFSQMLPLRWRISLNYTNSMRNGAVGPICFLESRQ